MAEQKNHNLIIVGSGPAGLTAGIYAGRSHLKPLIIDGEEPGGQLMGTTAVENWPGEKSILGPQLMATMREHAKSTGCEFQSGKIISVDFSKKPFLLTTLKQEFYARSVIIATGATPKRLGVPGENEYWGRGVSTCAVCDGAFYQDQPVVIVGGGDTSMESASFMTNFTKDITIIQISEKLSASVAMQEKVIANPNIKIIYNSTVTEIAGDDNHVNQVTLTNQATKQTSKLTTNAVFLAIGLSPNTAFLGGQLKTDQMGYLSLLDHTKTSVEGVFGAGDVADCHYRQAITSAGSGCMAALDAERYLRSI